MQTNIKITNALGELMNPSIPRLVLLSACVLIAAASAQAQGTSRVFDLDIVNGARESIAISVTDQGGFQGTTSQFAIAPGATQKIWCAGAHRSSDGQAYFKVELKDPRFRGESLSFEFWKDGGTLLGPKLNPAESRHFHFNTNRSEYSPQQLPGGSEHFSDHRYTLTLLEPAELSVGKEPANGAVLSAGSPVVVKFKGLPPQVPCRIAVAAKAVPDNEGKPHLLIDRDNNGDTDGELPFPSLSLAPGEYEARLYIDYDKNAPMVDARYPFQVVAAPVVKTVEASYRTGQSIEVQYSHLPGKAKDAIVLAKAGSPDTEVSPALRQFTGGEQQGTMSFRELPPGEYEVRFFPDGVTTRSAAARYNFRVANNADQPVVRTGASRLPGGLMSSAAGNVTMTETTFTFTGTLLGADSKKARLQCTFQIQVPGGGWQALTGVDCSSDFTVSSDSYDISPHELKILSSSLLVAKDSAPKKLRAKAVLSVAGEPAFTAAPAEFYAKNE